LIANNLSTLAKKQ